MSEKDEDEVFIPSSHTGARARYMVIVAIKKMLKDNGGDVRQVVKIYRPFYTERKLHEFIEIAKLMVNHEHSE